MSPEQLHEVIKDIVKNETKALHEKIEQLETELKQFKSGDLFESLEQIVKMKKA